MFDEIKILQEKINFEIIIINNGSTDNSSNVIDLNKHKLNNFNLITIKLNVGIGYAIKAGIKISKTNLISSELVRVLRQTTINPIRAAAA